MVLAASSRLIAREELGAKNMKAVGAPEKKKGIWKTSAKKQGSKKAGFASWSWALGSDVFCDGWLR
eukprot:1145450-Pyramimonas_sp.AAC.1